MRIQSIIKLIIVHHQNMKIRLKTFLMYNKIEKN